MGGAVTFFISYSRRDTDAVRILANDLQRTRHDLWMDEELGGGEPWWEEILDRIRRCEVFVLALSDHSMASQPCRAELDYAVALGVPVLPVQVGEVGSLRTLPIAERQVVDLRDRVRAGRSAVVDTGIALVVAALDLRTKRAALPDPLPAPPPIPFEYLMQLRLAVDASELDSRRQLQVLTQLKQALRDEQDPAIRQDLAALLRRLRQHPDVTYRNAQEIDDILRAVPGPDQAGARVDPHIPVSAELQRPPRKSATPTSSSTSVRRQVDERVPAALSSTATRDDRAATPTRSSRLSLTAAVLGGLGVGQAGALFAYTPTFYYAVDVTAGQYRFDSRSFMSTMWVLLVLAVVGVAVGAVAAHRSEPHGRTATATAALGVVVVGTVLSKYSLA